MSHRWSDADITFFESASVVDVSPRSALIAWGRFPLKVLQRSGPETVVEVIDYSNMKPSREFVGEGALNLETVKVEVADEAGIVVFAQTFFAGAPSVARIDSLQPNTRYTYRIMNTSGASFAPPTKLRPLEEKKLVMTTAPPVTRSFRTHPDPSAPTPPFRFFVVGDTGTGALSPPSSSKLQSLVAAKMVERLRAVDLPQVRFVLTLGDTVYARKNFALDLAANLVGAGWMKLARDSGDEDDDWLAAYFYPYQELLATVPFYQAAGNHDGKETEEQEDRDQLVRNAYIWLRFGAAGLHPQARYAVPNDDDLDDWGLFYSVQFGRDFELAALDTCAERPLSERSFVGKDSVDSFLAFDQRPHFVVPFGHHPPFGAGPAHISKSHDIRRTRLALWREHRLLASNIVASFFGHEHNFQHYRAGAQNVFVSGAGGKAATGRPTPNEWRVEEVPDLRLEGLGTGGHFLECTYDGSKLRIEARGVETSAPSDASFSMIYGSPVVEIECSGRR